MFRVMECWRRQPWMFYLSHYEIMTHSHFDTWHHNKISKARQANNMTRDSKTVNLTHFRKLLICNLLSRNTSHSHDNLRRVSKSPLLHPFTHRRSGTLDWRVTRATSADSSRLIHTILANSSTAASSTLLHCIIVQPFLTTGHLEFKLLQTFTINFSLSKPDFTKYFTSAQVLHHHYRWWLRH